MIAYRTIWEQNVIMSEKILRDISVQNTNHKPKTENYLISELSFWWIISFIFFAYLFIGRVSQEFIYNDSLYYRSYSGALTNQTIEGIIGFQSRFWWAGYAATPILLLLKFLFASICIGTRTILSGELLVKWK